ncbi:MAG TPA: PVC-type heme-binding CxxCH protein, partial [Fimbriiglobus sp.]|nr:PVC-type heme-binding CxxCH protein [Fimbriiglobus sp.]
IPHCYHIVQGGRYERQAGQHFNPYTYDDIKTIADHRHYAGPNPHGGNEKSDSMGGGHAHCGLMCYLGGAWPKEYRGQLFMGNIHGRRLNVDIPVAKGSGYVAKHGKDFLLANDEWARFINFRYGPDGNVYVIDWYDKQACHRREPEIWDRTNGRIYKVSYRGTKPVAGIDLQKCSDEELVRYQLHENDWYVRHARRVLQERSVSREPKASAAVREALMTIATEHKDETRRLRGLWALIATGTADYEGVSKLADDKFEHVRGWALRWLIEGEHTDRFLSQRTDVCGLLVRPSAVARRQIASALLRNPGRQPVSPQLLHAVAGRPEDVDDPNMVFLSWYLLEQLIDQQRDTVLSVATESKMTALLPFAARRIGATGTKEAFQVLTERLLDSKTDDQRLALLRGVSEGLKGRRGITAPTHWSQAFAVLAESSNKEVQSQALAVAVGFGDAKAFDLLRKTLADQNADYAARQAAMTTLLDAKDKDLAPILQLLVLDSQLRSSAIRGLASYDHADTPRSLLALYETFTAADKRNALNTLAARSAYAKVMLDAIAAKKVPAADVPAEIIRQLRGLGDKKLDEQITAVWGTVRDTPADRKKLITSWQKKLTAPYQGGQDLAAGRAVFARVCQQCHTLYGVGAKVGPDITGANRADINYLLENIFDPSAVVPKEYAATKIDLLDGRSITGLIKEETKTTLTIATANETLTVPVADVDKRTPSPLSMMPDDLTKQATEAEIRALIAYLRHPQQVPILATQENAKEFFNGKDLTGWDGDKEVWSVENGEIVGKTAKGLKRNNFLKSTMDVADFKLTLKVKLVPNSENSGIQFRSVPIEGGEMRGPQADIGKGWWGKLYEESGRGLLWKEDGDKHVKPEDWNEYVVEAKGSKVRTWINGQLCVDLDDPKLSRRGVIAVQVHSGGPMEVRFKDIKLEVLGEKK